MLYSNQSTNICVGIHCTIVAIVLEIVGIVDTHIRSSNYIYAYMHSYTHTYIYIHIYTYTYLILSSISFTLLHLLVSYWFLGYDEVILHRCGICTYIATSPLWGSYQYINISRYFQWGLVLYTYPLALYIKLMNC